MDIGLGSNLHMDIWLCGGRILTLLGRSSLPARNSLAKTVDTGPIIGSSASALYTLAKIVDTRRVILPGRVMTPVTLPKLLRMSVRWTLSCYCYSNCQIGGDTTRVVEQIKSF